MRWLTLHYDHTLLVNLLGNKEAEQLLSIAYKVTIAPLNSSLFYLFTLHYFICLLFIILFVYSLLFAI